MFRDRDDNSQFQWFGMVDQLLLLYCFLYYLSPPAKMLTKAPESPQVERYVFSATTGATQFKPTPKPS